MLEKNMFSRLNKNGSLNFILFGFAIIVFAFLPLSAVADEGGEGGDGEINPPAAACADGIDNDHDGLIDMADPGCSAPNDDNESNQPVTDCSDGIDNDRDGEIDYPADEGCTSRNDDDEGIHVPPPTECSDFIDNDHDGFIDMADPDCSSPSGDDEGDYTPQCSDHRDNDHDGFVDMSDPGCYSRSDNSEYNPPPPPPPPPPCHACSDGIDNDSDGAIDMADPGCSSPTDNDENARPVIMLLGENPFIVTLDESFIDPGATASDFEDGDLTSQILLTGSVDNHAIGDYLLRYNVIDSDGFAAEERTRAVLVRAACADGRDNDGDGLIDMNDSGCSDSSDNDESGEVSTPACSDGIDNDNDGEIDYPADDGCENESDNNENAKPEITLLGDNPMTATLNELFVDPGATASDSEDGDISSQIAATGTIDIYATGTYFRYYDVTDSGGQAADQKTRTVFVKTQCEDSRDNDGDGFIDLADPDCVDENDRSEFSEPENHAPVWNGPTYASTTIGNSFDLTIIASDPDGDLLTVTSTIPEGASYNAETGQFLWTPLATGTASSYFSASDGAISTDFILLLEIFSTSTSTENLPPYFVNFNPSTAATATISYSYDVEAIDPESATLTFSLEISPSGMMIASSTGVIEWTPGESQASSTPYLVRVAVSDGVNSTSTSYEIVVNSEPSEPPPTNGGGGAAIIVSGGGGGSANYPPRFRDFNPPIFATATELYAYDVDAYDLENDPIIYSLNKAPQGMIIASSTGFITWYPTLVQVSVIPYEVVVMISDGRGSASERYFVTVVTGAYAPLPPVVVLPPAEAEESLQLIPGEILGEEVATTTLPATVCEEENPSFFALLLSTLGGNFFGPFCLFVVLVLLCLILYLLRKNRKLREELATLESLEEKKETDAVYEDIPIVGPESAELTS